MIMSSASKISLLVSCAVTAVYIVITGFRDRPTGVEECGTGRGAITIYVIVMGHTLAAETEVLPRLPP